MQRVRGENGIDPNRDFPFDNSPEACMRTTTGRAINEVFREFMFRSSITFHGGMQAIAYEWGAPSRQGSSSASESPDDSAQNAIASVMSATAGSFLGTPYPYDRANINVSSAFSVT